ncbi:flavonol sulfotransferase-like [Chenopodium quinoa]|uniref:Sulfotransferase n=1 Tax=Chenopodium quinoa TaxID=63459 RepID=A0A803MZW4_CHEQI|nr:flavonol sulfotransferase-like [Chenopodium quinoa]
MNENQTKFILKNDEEKIQEVQNNLPKSPFMGSELVQLAKYQNFWYGDMYIQNILKLQRNFVAQDTDLIIGSLMKTGTTWLKALLFAIVKRIHHAVTQSPLLSHHPHEHVHSLEPLYGEHPSHNPNDIPLPRLFSTHLSYTSLPESIKNSKCRILYICRNPLDMLVSLYFFSINFMKKQVEDFKPPSMEEFFEDFHDGRHPCGPFFEHVVEFWKTSLERPEKVLFLKYEDLKDDPTFHLKRLAKFIGVPFSPQEESEGVITQIIELCSIKTMKELEVNKSDDKAIDKFFDKKTYFRKGEVGDWINHFTPTMVERMKNLMEEKLKGTGLSFTLLPQ